MYYIKWPHIHVLIQLATYATFLISMLTFIESWPTDHIPVSTVLSAGSWHFRPSDFSGFSAELL